MATVDKKAFEGLEDKYNDKLKAFKKDYSLLTFSTEIKKVKRKEQVMIIAHNRTKLDFKKAQ